MLPRGGERGYNSLGDAMTGETLFHPDHEMTIGEDGIVLRRDTSRVLRGLMLTFAGTMAITALLFAVALWPRDGQWPHPEGVECPSAWLCCFVRC